MELILVQKNMAILFILNIKQNKYYNNKYHKSKPY